MFSKFKYSVIVPMYNSESTIERCVQSVLKQGREDVELLLIDDGSEDQTGNIAKELLKKACNKDCAKYFHTSNAGVSKTRNYGISLAKGHYLIFLDSDDYLAEGFFDKLDQAGDCELLIFGMSTQNRNRYKKSCRMIAKMLYMEQMTTLFNRGILLSSSNKRFSREMVLKNHLQFPEKISIGEDFVFSLSYCLCCKELACVEDIIYMVDTSNIESLSRKYRKNLSSDLKRVYKLTYALVKYADFSDKEKMQLLRCLDYSYAKSTCTCIGELFKVQKPSYRIMENEIQTICEAFRRPLSRKAGYANILHIALRTLLFYRINFGIYFVTYLKKRGIYKKYQHV